MPKVSISLDRETADLLKQNGKSLGEVVKEIVLQYAQRGSRIENVGVIYNIAMDIAEQLESESSNIYSIIGQVRAMIRAMEAIGLYPSEIVYLKTMDSILETAMKTDMDGCKLIVVKAILGVIVLYIISLLYGYSDVV
jgi:hypothetical protein